MESSDHFKPVLDSLGPVVHVAATHTHTIVLIGEGEVWMSGKEKSRLPSRVDLGPKPGKILSIGAMDHLDILVRKDRAGNILNGDSPLIDIQGRGSAQFILIFNLDSFKIFFIFQLWAHLQNEYRGAV